MICFHSRGARFLGFLALLVGFACCSSLQATIRYEVSLAHPEQHLFHVTMTIPDVDNEVLIQIPAWNALYQIRDFSSHIQQVEVRQGSAQPRSHPATEVATPSSEKIDKQTWRITGNGTVVVRYATYWDEPGPFATQLNREHAFINPAMILMYVPERRSEEVHLGLDDVPLIWQGSGPGIQMIEQMGRARHFSATFADYDALADAPIETGKYEEFQLPGMSPEVWVIIHGDNYKKKQVEAELKRICEYEIKLMGKAPYWRYTFIVHIGKGATDAGGGMEHADSTAIFVPSGEALASVAAHEFFHLWNVKRIRPATLYPVDYTKEQYTRALWFAEGVTSTYGSYTLERSGLWSKQQLYHDLSEQITELEARPANLWQSAEQSSLDAWLEKYSLYENPEHSVSYYTKGQILGVLLDILIRDRTDNQKGLDDVLREMNKNFGVPGKPYRDSLDVQLTAEKVAGVSFEDFFKYYVAGANALPYQAIFPLAGLELRQTTRQHAALGFAAEGAPKGPLVVRTVAANSAAAEAGLQAGDFILKWNGGDPPRRSNDWLRQHKAGELLHLVVRREGAELKIDFHLGEITETFYDLAEDSRAGDKARHIREGLLHGVTDAPTMHAAN
ncbi:MAG TPA: PDZ domain-containing protein [Methylomirabilota bacterium]|nr:PDZ domain-containing protein [Methylomirabilota bacterium]